jgi:hypothetical protein
LEQKTSIASGKELLVIVGKPNAQFFFPEDLITLHDSLRRVFISQRADSIHNINIFAQVPANSMWMPRWIRAIAKTTSSQLGVQHFFALHAKLDYKQTRLVSYSNISDNKHGVQLAVCASQGV